MYTVKIKSHFSAAHSLRDYSGECERLHGHNWEIEVCACALELSEKTGMLIDFKILKKITNGVLKPLDHQYLNEIEPFTTLNPTAENIAAYIYQQINTHIAPPVQLKSVTVWETKNACAIYEQ